MAAGSWVLTSVLDRPKIRLQQPPDRRRRPTAGRALWPAMPVEQRARSRLRQDPRAHLRRGRRAWSSARPRRSLRTRRATWRSFTARCNVRQHILQRAHVATCRSTSCDPLARQHIATGCGHERRDVKCPNRSSRQRACGACMRACVQRRKRSAGISCRVGLARTLCPPSTRTAAPSVRAPLASPRTSASDATGGADRGSAQAKGRTPIRPGPERIGALRRIPTGRHGRDESVALATMNVASARAACRNRCHRVPAVPHPGSTLRCPPAAARQA